MFFKVDDGMYYHLTVIVGETDCQVNNISNHEQEFNEEICVINLDHDNNHICDVVVHQRLKGRSFMSDVITSGNPLLSLDGSPANCRKSK